jgi:hypothetical protein
MKKAAANGSIAIATLPKEIDRPRSAVFDVVSMQDREEGRMTAILNGAIRPTPTLVTPESSKQGSNAHEEGGEGSCGQQRDA